MLGGDDNELSIALRPDLGSLELVEPRQGRHRRGERIGETTDLLLGALDLDGGAPGVVPHPADEPGRCRQPVDRGPKTHALHGTSAAQTKAANTHRGNPYGPG